MANSGDYTRGYQVGRRKGLRDLDKARQEMDTLLKKLKLLDSIAGERDERMMLKCLEMVVQNCTGWSIGGEKITDAKGCVELAKIFKDNLITAMRH